MEAAVIILKTATLLLFFLLFSSIAVWAYLPANRESLEAQALIPLDDQRKDSENG